MNSSYLISTIWLWHLLITWRAEESVAEAESEPVEKLYPRDEAEPEEEAEESAYLGNEVDGRHPQRALELEHSRLLGYK